MSKELYQRIAAQSNTTPEQVEEELQILLETWWNNTPLEKRKLVCPGEVMPTKEEFIQSILEGITRKN